MSSWLLALPTSSQAPYELLALVVLWRNHSFCYCNSLLIKESIKKLGKFTYFIDSIIWNYFLPNSDNALKF